MNNPIPLLPEFTTFLTLIDSVQSVTARADAVVYQNNSGSIDSTVYGHLKACADATSEEVLSCSTGNKTLRCKTSFQHSASLLLERRQRPRFIRTTVMAGAMALIFIAAALVHPERAESQPLPPPSKPAQTPIDGGLGVLVSTGEVYSVKKLRGGIRAESLNW